MSDHIIEIEQIRRVRAVEMLKEWGLRERDNGYSGIPAEFNPPEFTATVGAEVDDFCTTLTIVVPNWELAHLIELFRKGGMADE
jgi:hypothetical protein